MSRPYLLIPRSERSRPLLRFKADALMRFKRAGIPMPQLCPVMWTRRGQGTAYYQMFDRAEYLCSIPIHLKEYIQGKHPNAMPYLEYYVIHELCHIADKFNGTQTTPHGRPFHKIFSMVCPKKYWRFEQEYQPQFEARLEEWGLEIPDQALIRPYGRDLKYIKQGYTIATT